MIDLQMYFNYSDKDKEKLYQRLTVFFFITYVSLPRFFHADFTLEMRMDRWREARKHFSWTLVFLLPVSTSFSRCWSLQR